MFQLNHAHLPASDVASLRDFLVAHFDFRALTTRGRDAFSVLEGAGGFTLALMRTDDLPTLDRHLHVGFYVDSTEAVRAKHADLSAAGFQPGPVEAVSRAGFTSLTFYCNAPGGLLIEVTCPR